MAVLALAASAQEGVSLTVSEITERHVETTANGFEIDTLYQFTMTLPNGGYRVFWDTKAENIEFVRDKVTTSPQIRADIPSPERILSATMPLTVQVDHEYTGYFECTGYFCETWLTWDRDLDPYSFWTDEWGPPGGGNSQGMTCSPEGECWYFSGLFPYMGRSGWWRSIIMVWNGFEEDLSEARDSWITRVIGQDGDWWGPCIPWKSEECAKDWRGGTVDRLVSPVQGDLQFTWQGPAEAPIREPAVYTGVMTYTSGLDVHGSAGVHPRPDPDEGNLRVECDSKLGEWYSPIPYLPFWCFFEEPAGLEPGVTVTDLYTVTIWISQSGEYESWVWGIQGDAVPWYPPEGEDEKVVVTRRVGFQIHLPLVLRQY